MAIRKTRSVTVSSKSSESQPMVMTAMSAKGSNSEEQDLKINRLAVGLQPKDIIALANVLYDLKLTDENKKSALETYKSNIGGFLESKGIIPEGAGIMFNAFQKGATLKDAVMAYAKAQSLDEEAISNLIGALSSGQLPGVIKYITTNSASKSSVTVTLNTNTQLTQNAYVAIESLIFAGSVVESDPVTVKVTPTNCKFKGLASSPEEEKSEEYVFASQTTLDALNTEFASLQVNATNTSDVKLSVVINDGTLNDFTFANVTPAE